ncbi:zinc finger FYVE domain-containing protein 26 [Dendroctonus ponderosae]|nr:zinc finger FYVE domain-containing protein 26 [Dendroctonus ponderosae]KAH1006644.1 hypothetical protein HUJ05_007356 [Dendroctonus ponderosae]
MQEVLIELAETPSVLVQDKFYRHFSSLDPTSYQEIEELIAKVWALIETNHISKGTLYLSLLQKSNNDLLEKCISWERGTLNSNVLQNLHELFEFTVYTGKHWFLELIRNKSSPDIDQLLPEAAYQKLVYLRIVHMTNDPSWAFDRGLLDQTLAGCSNNVADNFWVYYTKEIAHLLQLFKIWQDNCPSGLNEREFLAVASQRSILDLASHYLQLDAIEQVFAQLDQSQFPHAEDLENQRTTLACFGLLAKFLSLLLHGDKDIDVPKLKTEIQIGFMQLKSHCLQIELLRVMFACIFTKQHHIKDCQGDAFICNSKELNAMLFTIKALIEALTENKAFEDDPHSSRELQEILQVVSDAAWRLSVVVNVISPQKSQKKLLYYMQADPEGLVNLCLKQGHFERAFQVLKIFNMQSTPLAQEIIYTDQLQDLKQNLKRTAKLRQMGENRPDSWMKIPNDKLDLDKIVQTFFRKLPPPQQEDSSLNHAIFMNVLDLAISQTPSRDLVPLACKLSPRDVGQTPFSLFTEKLLKFWNEPGDLDLVNSPLEPDTQRKSEDFYATIQNIYSEFCDMLLLNEPGFLDKDHPSHQVIQRLQEQCSSYLELQFKPEELTNYLQKLWNYLRAFSRVLYIERDNSDLVAEGHISSYFKLLGYNRSELMGNLLFQQNLNPAEFERHFGKLKLDFVYHVVGNCFPTINLHADENVAKEELYHENVLYPPSESMISYIRKRNWLLALILIEMYKVKDLEFDVGELRIRNFLNYLHLPKIQHLQPLFNNNEIITALQNDISFQKVQEFVQNNRPSEEDRLKSTTWRRLAGVLDSIPEKQLKHEDFQSLKDLVLANLGSERVMEIKDRDARFNLLVGNLKIWPLDVCIRSIKSEISRFDQTDDHKVDELKAWLEHIEQSKQVMNVLEVENWASLYEMCAFQPQAVLYKLLESKQVDLLIEFLQLHEVSEELLLGIDEHFMEMAFDMDLDFESVQRVFNFLSPDRIIDLCRNLLSLLREVRHLQMVTDHLLKYTQEDNLTSVALSLKLLSPLTESGFDQQLLFLLKHPLSIIEVLIMNTQLDKLGDVLGAIPADSDIVSVADVDALLRHYAEKSLDFRVIAQPNPDLLRTPEHSLMQSLDSVLLGLHYSAFIMPDKVPARDEWVPNTEVIECMCCRNEHFSMFNRRHHCRRCGRVICYTCSQRRMLVPTYGDILVRVCIQCYRQTFAENSLADESIATRSYLNNYWMLTSDPEHNSIVKQEFSYEFAPSVSLCLALMKFHSKNDTYSTFLLNQCEVLLKLVVPNQEPLQEIDYMLVIRMLKSLALAAKVVSVDCSSPHSNVSAADQILMRAELLGLLAERGCLNLLLTPSSSCFVDPTALMRFIEKLLEKEQWTLALEVSTKAGMDKSGVFAAWGKSCLIAGDLASAREKFSKSYDTEHFTLKGIKSLSKLNEIINILESRSDSIDAELLNNHRKLLEAGQATTQSDRAVFILSKLKNLNNIASGNYATSKGKTTRKPKLHDTIYQECVYYLDKYGTASSLVEFHIKYEQFAKAVDVMIKKRLPADEFVDIYMRCLKVGSVTVLQAAMSEIDPSLCIWKDYLVKICRHLTQQNLFHSLYQLQLYMGDYVRAAMSCVNFYEDKATTFSDLQQRRHYLTEALSHLSRGREQEQWVAVTAVETDKSGNTFEITSIVSNLIKQMSTEEIERHSATIRKQLEVVEFLAQCETGQVSPMEVFLEIFPNPNKLPKHRIWVPTLLGSEEQRMYMAVLCIVCAEDFGKGFDFGSCIANEFQQLKPLKVYKETARYLAKVGKTEAITNLVVLIMRTLKDQRVNDICDEVLILAITILSKTDAIEAEVEELIKLICDKSAMICAYIETKQLKKAYFLAAKYRKVKDMKNILREAELTNQGFLKDLCQKAIQYFNKTSAAFEESD